MNKKRSSKWILVALTLAAMIGTASFAVTSLSAGDVGTIPAGASVDSSGTVSTLRTFQWSENCTITASAAFTTSLAKCTKHTAVINVSAAKGTKGNIEIQNLQCFASTKPTLLRVTVDASSKLLLDLLPTGSSDIDSVRIGSSNEWFAKANKCGDTNNNNKFLMELRLLDTGDPLGFTINVEEIKVKGNATST